ncbi:MAG: AbrB/MazE/SpoVT family DNA-binding domain-containing protein [Microthrixaceae bacterium]
MLASIDKAGRIVIPKEIRDRLDLVPETELSIEVQGDSIRIERVARPRRRLEFTDDGRPFFAGGDDQVTTDLDVQRLRDADRR